jgi:membrane protein implicated in regulation of membrane protease activity
VINLPDGRLAGLAREELDMQIIFFAVVGIAAYFGFRSFVREADRVTAKVRRAEKQAANGTMGTLVKDPKTGEYRLAKD